jgi:hypothetical protein
MTLCPSKLQVAMSTACSNEYFVNAIAQDLYLLPHIHSLYHRPTRRGACPPYHLIVPGDKLLGSMICDAECAWSSHFATTSTRQASSIRQLIRSLSIAAFQIIHHTMFCHNLELWCSEHALRVVAFRITCMAAQPLHIDALPTP